MRIGRATAVTDTGRRRLRNEDAFVFEPPLFAIADGMGGAQAGELASRLAAAAIEEAGAAAGDAEAVAAAVRAANARIFERSLTDPAVAGMGTTATVALVDEHAGTLTIAHVGDSRGYRYRGGVLEQLTTDHSLVAELVRSGVLTPEEAERHPQRSAITRAVGTERAIDADVFTMLVEPGDLFLLCSDGLTDMLSKNEIAETIIAAERDPDAAARALVAAANAHGGEDNITVVLFELVEGEPEPEPEPEQEQEQAPDAAASAAATELASEDTQPGVRRHGAGPGGRIAALAFIALVIVVGVIALYWGITR